MTDEITRWFAVRTAPGSEFDAALELTIACMRPWLWYRIEERLRGPAHRRLMKPVPKAYFEGYVFVPATRHISKILDCRHVREVVSDIDGKGRRTPMPISHRQLIRLADYLNVQGNCVVPDGDPERPEDLVAGMQLKVTDGPFMSFLGSLKESAPADGKTRIEVMIDMFGRETAVELDQNQVEAV